MPFDILQSPRDKILIKFHANGAPGDIEWGICKQEYPSSPILANMLSTFANLHIYKAKMAPCFSKCVFNY